MVSKEKYEKFIKDADKNVSAVITVKMNKMQWEAFKSMIPRKKKLNDAVVELILEKICEDSESMNDKELEEYIEETY